MEIDVGGHGSPGFGGRARRGDPPAAVSSKRWLVVSTSPRRDLTQPACRETSDQGKASTPPLASTRTTADNHYSGTLAHSVKLGQSNRENSRRGHGRAGCGGCHERGIQRRAGDTPSKGRGFVSSPALLRVRWLCVAWASEGGLLVSRRCRRKAKSSWLIAHGIVKRLPPRSYSRAAAE